MGTLTHSLRVVFALGCLLGMASLLTHSSDAAPAAPVSTSPARGYYVTQGTTGIDGSHALKGCAAGYHMASMYEIADTTSLTYRKVLGFNQDDSGFGPPWGVFGWVRTGNVSNNGGSPGLSSGGESNCNNWTSNSSTDYGTMMLILQPMNNLSQPHYSMGPWVVVADACNFSAFVWCVQN